MTTPTRRKRRAAGFVSLVVGAVLAFMRRLPATPLRRTIRSEELTDRISPWRGTPIRPSHSERRSPFPWPQGDQ